MLLGVATPKSLLNSRLFYSSSLDKVSYHRVEFAVIISTTGSIGADMIMHDWDQHLITRFNPNCSNFRHASLEIQVTIKPLR